MAKKIVMVVASLAVIGACAWFVWPKSKRIPREELMRPYVCEECDHHFRAVPVPQAIACPKCQKPAAVLYHEYECRKCGEKFEAFRERQAGAGGGPPSPDEPPAMEYKRPGSRWVGSAELLGGFACPKCKSTDVGPVPRKPAAK